MTTHEVKIPKKCPLCGIGTLEKGESVALIRYNTETKELLIKSPTHVEVIPTHLLACNNCGYVVLLSATKVPEL